MLYEIGERVMVDLGQGWDVEGVKECTVEKFLEWFTKYENDGSEYYAVIPDEKRSDPEFDGITVSSKKMMKL